jgi:hypothetical protein
MNTTNQNPPSGHVAYSVRTADYYLERMEGKIYSSFSSEQLTSIRAALESAIPKSSHKIVDLRLNIDLIISRFYIVLFVGKDRRKQRRMYRASGFTKIANIVASLLLLIGINLTISLLIFLVAYLLKSALGINLFAGHLSDYLH